MPIISLILTAAQKRALEQGKNIRLPKPIGQAPTMIEISEEMQERIQKAESKGQGCLLKGAKIQKQYSSLADDDEEVEGGSLKSIRKRFNKATKQVNKGIRHIPGYVKDGSHELGAAVQVGKKYVPAPVTKAILGTAAQIAATAASGGNPAAGLAAKAAVNAGIQATYDTNLKHGSVGKNFGKNFGRAFASEAAMAAASTYTAPPAGGAGFRPLTSGGRLPKGSQAAKDRMALLRASRRTTSVQGRGFLPL